MKNKSTGTGDTRKKGFYAALAAGAGAVVVLALVISFSNLTITSPDPQQHVYDPGDTAYDEDAVVAGADYTRPYLAHADDQALFRPRQSPAPDQEQQPGAPGRQTPGQQAPGQQAPGQQAPADAPASTLPQTAPEPGQQGAPAGEPATPTTDNEAPESPAQDRTPATTPSEPATNDQAYVPASFEPFTEYDQLVWPVYGDIAMIFSRDRLIYNPTLDQWRTNDDLRISAQEGTPVRAAAAGKVAEVGTDRVYGNFVRVDNGNGWETIFGQLMDGILVVEGDIVQAGQVIGGVGRPSVFSVLNGHHVSLRVMHEETLIDPQLLLADVRE